jgi:tetratricopeptide (TPR) repeat protein/tRNA A-37 threonylcarbamoyl transferase component Bud32
MPANTPAPSSKYRLIRPLGEGGMGAVYLAHDTALNREVALKFVAADMLADAGARKRLVREAQAAAALDHPAICAVHDIELRSDGEVCIVMQYIEGETLASRLTRGVLTVREALMLTAELADALAAAHKRGIVHRDIKPQNIMVTAGGRAKLLDFGIATLADALAVSSADAETTEATRPIAAGTPPYMSPEQVTQRPIDGRSDLFSLGCVLYECLTGRPAFRGRNALEISGQVLHVHPPAPSMLRPELSAEHDELVRRLLAKDPADRFQSAEELLGALRVLLPDTARAQTSSHGGRLNRGWRSIALAIVVAVGVGAFGWWYSTRPLRLPEPPPQAARWFDRGTNAIREGAYYAAKLALEQALAIFPDYPQAHTRLAEALIELDEGEAARDALIEANRLVHPARLPPADKARNEAVQAMLLREPDTAIKAYRRLIDLQPGNPGAWVDLARVQESAGLWSEARQSLATALAQDKENAVAHLRLGKLEAQEGHRQEALTAFANAERLYHAAADLEGVAETVFQRGAFLDGLGEVKEARTALERARTLATTTKNQYQTLRADLRLSSVAAAEGQYGASQKLAADAIRAAREADLDTVAADGLIELGATLMQSRQLQAAETQLAEAIAIARREKAEGLALRATLNLASLRQAQGRPAEAMSLAESALQPLRTRRERRKVLSALAIMTRAQQDLEQYVRAREIAQQLLAGAQEVGDQPSLALAYESLAAQATVFGDFPLALEYRTRVEEIHRRLADASSLPFDLTNRGEMLIRLGRTQDADAPLREVEEGIGRQVDAFVGRRRRVLLLRALQATTSGRFPEAREYARAVIGPTGQRSDETGQMATALLAYVEAHSSRIKRGGIFTEPDARLAVRREIRYWQLATALAIGDADHVLDGVRTSLEQLSAVPSDEYAWRLAALGSIAATRLRKTEEAATLHARAKDALGRVRSSWGEHARPYERRPDLTGLRTRAGL